jgi:hypothetical protein
MAKHMTPIKPTDKEVGYGRPPEHSKFKKGQSGNRSGKRRGTKNLSTITKEVLQEPISIVENGKPRKITKLEALFRVQLDLALKGNQRAFTSVMKTYLTPEMRHELEVDATGGPVVIDENISPEEAERNFLRMIKGDRYRG